MPVSSRLALRKWPKIPRKREGKRGAPHPPTTIKFLSHGARAIHQAPRSFQFSKPRGPLSPCPRPAASLTTQGPCDGRKRDRERVRDRETHTTASRGEGLASSKGKPLLSTHHRPRLSPVSLLPTPPPSRPPQVATAPPKYKGHGSQQSPKTLGKKPPWHEIKKTQGLLHNPPVVPP